METGNQNFLFEQSKKLVPGGVHSPVRSFKGLTSTPRFIERGEGAYIYDVEGKDYIDFCMSFGPLILGHTHPKVLSSLEGALKKGWSYGACEPYSLELAQYLLDRIPFADKIRFVNSGTEAVMTALRLARGYTGRDKIIKFNGCYHGHVDSMLIKAGSGLAGTSEASSKGVPESISQDTLILDLGDAKGVKDCFERFGNQIAAIIIEPLPANNGLLIQEESFLKFLREISEEHGSLLIFDEVISGFRVGFTGMAGKTNIAPDIVTYGKVIGGGLPVGAMASRSEIMDCLAPLGGVYQAGTLSANPLAMVGGLTNLKELTPEAYEELEKNTLAIVQIFEEWLKEYDGGKFSHYRMISAHSLFWLVPTSTEQKQVEDIPADLAEQFLPLFETLLEKGIYLSPNAYEVGFISTAHGKEVQSSLRERLWN